MTGASGYHRALATAGFFTLFAGDFWRYLFTWWGWGVVVVILLTATIVELVRLRVSLRYLPIPLVGFVLLCAASIIWSDYRVWSLFGLILTFINVVFAVFLARLLSWADVLAALSTAVRIILGASIVFEFIVAAFVRHPVLPFFTSYPGVHPIPMAFYWSRDLLFHGARIQGIQGNSDLLAMATLIGLIVFCVRFAAREGRRAANAAWGLIAVLVIVATRSSTVYVAAAATLVIALFLLVARRLHGVRHVAWHLAGLVVAAAAVVGGLTFHTTVAHLLGKSGTLTGRTDIWDKVVHLASQRPVGGWGWVSYWPPFVKPFKNLIVIHGVHYYQAHDTWIDLYFQLGVLGVIVFGALVLSALWRSWQTTLDATAEDQDAATRLGWPLALAAPLLLVAMVVQSIAESRLLIEGEFTLLVIVAIVTLPSRVRGFAGRVR